MSVINQSRYTENYVTGEYTFHVKCWSCNSTTDVTVRGEDLFKYQNGAFAQDAFPYLAPAVRELLISGTCPVCFP